MTDQPPAALVDLEALADDLLDAGWQRVRFLIHGHAEFRQDRRIISIKPDSIYVTERSPELGLMVIVVTDPVWQHALSIIHRHTLTGDQDRQLRRDADALWPKMEAGMRYLGRESGVDDMNTDSLGYLNPYVTGGDAMTVPSTATTAPGEPVVTVQQMRDLHTELHEQAERLKADIKAINERYRVVADERRALIVRHQSVTAKRGLVRHLLYDLGHIMSIDPDTGDVWETPVEGSTE